MDSLEAGNIFDTLYLKALLHPDSISVEVQQTLSAIKEEAACALAQRSLFDDPVPLDTQDARKANELPLSDWIETMTLNYLNANGGAITRRDHVTALQWPNEEETHVATFVADRQSDDGAEVLSLEHPRIRGLLSHFPRHTPGQRVHQVRMGWIPGNISGTWSLWQIAMLTSDRRRQRILPVFVHDDGRNLLPTARFLWDELNAHDWRIGSTLDESESATCFVASENAAMDQGRETYLQLRQEHLNLIRLEQEKAEYSFRARRKLLKAIGLPEVRSHRLSQLLSEEDSWKRAQEREKQVLPQLVPIAILRIN